jgi:hypothetical protein
VESVGRESPNGATPLCAGARLTILAPPPLAGFVFAE